MEEPADELKQLKSTLEKKEEHLKLLTEQLAAKDQQIEVCLKEKQISEKEIQVQSLQNQLHAKEIEELQITLGDREKKLSQSKVNLNLTQANLDTSNTTLTQKITEIEEKDQQITSLNNKIQELEEEAKLLALDIDAADEEVEELTEKLEALRFNVKNGTYLSRAEVFKSIEEILESALHNVILTTRTIDDIKDLRLFDIKPSVNIKISCYVDIADQVHARLLDEYQVFDNIDIRAYDGQDRYSILKDGDGLFLAAVGETEDFLTFNTRDAKHIKMFNSLIMESWLRARKI